AIGPSQREILCACETKADEAHAFGSVRSGADGGPLAADAEVTRKYDGSPILKAGGAFIAGLASHPSAEANSLVVRSVPAIVTGSSRMRQRRTT
ncbi:MAG TPA: hypothetical protein VHI98_16665, partial [Vicinamibacterales bacterium]|nr:hypothetical protein [Vicinamibacterales bacterium]